MKTLFSNMAKIIFKFRWAVIVGWTVFLVVSSLFAGQVGGLLTGGGWDDPYSDSHKASELMIEEFDGRNATSLTVVIEHDTYEVGSPEYSDALESISQFLKNEQTIDSVYTWVDVSPEIQAAFLGENKKTSIALVGMNIDEGFAQNIIADMQNRLSVHAEVLEFEAIIIGTPAVWGEMSKQSKEGLEKAHLYALPIILFVLIIVFRSIVSSLTPLVLATYSIVSALGTLYFVAQKVELSTFVLDSAMMLGIGVGIDFALIFVKRFKEELLGTNNDVNAALTNTMMHAGHAILFSGITIMGSMTAIVFTDIAAVRSIAIGVITVVFFLMVATLTLLPALLAILGKHVDALKIPFLAKESNQVGSSKWYSLTHKIMKRPLLYLIGTILVMLVLAFPATDLKVSTPDSRILPEETEVRKGLGYLQEGFGIGYSSPIQVVVTADDEKLTSEANLKLIEELETELQSIDNVVEVTSIRSLFPDMDAKVISTLLTEERDSFSSDVSHMINRLVSNDNEALVIDVRTNDYGSSETNRNIVNEIREQLTFSGSNGTQYQIYVGGETAQGMDTAESLNNSLSEVLMITLGLILLILVLTFRSIVLPIKAIFMNVLSLGATYGVLVAIFQWGWGSEILGFGDFGIIQSFIPILLLGLLFSLSTDYEVFLLSRIQEEYERGKSNEESVALGIERTAPMISGAALIMIGVFSSFAFAGVLAMQQLGLGMAVAIAIDATIVRLVLVPATMKLLGDLNWWFPGNKKTTLSNTQEQAKALDTHS